jgi:hypothetical protein
MSNVTTVLLISFSYTYVVVGGSIATYTRGNGQDQLLFSSWFTTTEEAVAYLVKHRGAILFN